LTTLAPDRTYLTSIKTYPINTEIRAVRTYNGAPSMPGAPSAMPSISLPSVATTGVMTMEVNTSMILLPKVPMKKRNFDSRVGFFANGYTVFDENSQRTEDQTFAVRWRLEPKNAEDAAKQKKGEIIEPKKPIIYYIDPATPAKWRKYLKAGIDDWQKALKLLDGKMLSVVKSWQTTTLPLALKTLAIRQFVILLLILKMLTVQTFMTLVQVKFWKVILVGTTT
jgi:hypothetical protein